MTGSDVYELIIILTKQRYLQPEDLDTEQLFSGAVENAVRAFQRANDLTANGTVDALTAIRLKQTTTTTSTTPSTSSATTYALGDRMLRKGMTGPDVNQLMMILIKHGYLKPDDINTEQLFTEAVENAVKAFQEAKDLTADGRVGALTAIYLKALK